MKLFETFQTLMTAAAFAEENEHATAREIASETTQAQSQPRGDRATVTGTLAVDHGK